MTAQMIPSTTEFEVRAEFAFYPGTFGAPKNGSVGRFASREEAQRRTDELAPSGRYDLAHGEYAAPSYHVAVAPAPDAPRYVVLTKAHFYGPSESGWNVLAGEDGLPQIFDRKADAFESFSGPDYLGHNVAYNEYRVYKVRAGVSVRDLDNAYGSPLTSGLLMSHPAKE